jgi:hypothetical protein
MPLGIRETYRSVRSSTRSSVVKVGFNIRQQGPQLIALLPVGFSFNPGVGRLLKVNLQTTGSIFVAPDALRAAGKNRAPRRLRETAKGAGAADRTWR